MGGCSLVVGPQVEHPSGLVQGVLVASLFLEQRVKVISRDACDNERSAGGLLRGFRISTELVADEVDEDAMGSRTQVPPLPCHPRPSVTPPRTRLSRSELSPFALCLLSLPARDSPGPPGCAPHPLALPPSQRFSP